LTGQKKRRQHRWFSYAALVALLNAGT
jgi:hypothetical protein